MYSEEQKRQPKFLFNITTVDDYNLYFTNCGSKHMYLILLVKTKPSVITLSKELPESYRFQDSSYKMVSGSSRFQPHERGT